MKINLKKLALTLIIPIISLIGYFFWLTSRPVEIIAVHQRSSGYSAILVKSFPLTDKGKINWWLENHKDIGNKYRFPSPDQDGSYYITFWLFGEGYKEEGKYDRLCFQDMQPPINCIDKNAVFSIENDKNKELLFTVYDGKYRMKKNSKIIKINND